MRAWLACVFESERERARERFVVNQIAKAHRYSLDFLLPDLSRSPLIPGRWPSQGAVNDGFCVKGSRGSESSPHGSPTPAGGPQGGSSEEIWVLRKPVAGNSGAASSTSSSSSLMTPPALPRSWWSCCTPGLRNLLSCRRVGALKDSHLLSHSNIHGVVPSRAHVQTIHWCVCSRMANCIFNEGSVSLSVFVSVTMLTCLVSINHLVFHLCYVSLCHPMYQISALQWGSS